MSGAATRIVATQVLDAVLHRGRSLKAELRGALPKFSDPRDRALIEAICFVALRQRARYDAALAAWMPKPPGKRDGELRALLHAGFAQIDGLGLPPHAAVAETVEAARALQRSHQVGLVNAVLRRALRDGLPPGDPGAAWPDWLLQRVRREWPQQSDAIVLASAQAGPLWLRVNRQLGTRAACMARLQASGILVHASAGDAPDAPVDALRIDASLPVSALPGFADGEVSVQDAAAQWVADGLSPNMGARVLDACAAPGGKAAHLLERDPTLRLTALDIDAARLAQVRTTFTRLAIGHAAQLHAVDACELDAWWDGVPFDAILIDAPCSATGIVRRQPDILLHRRESDLTALLALQARLLDTLWTTLVPGGVLLYVTCSILVDENAKQVDAFLTRTPDAIAEPLDARFGRRSGAGRQRLPGEDGMDGFFYARLRQCS